MKSTSNFIVDFARRWGLIPYSPDMDTLNTLFIGWVVFAVFVLVIVKFLYSLYNSDSGDEVENEQHARTRANDKSATYESSFILKATIVPNGLPAAVPPPITTGADPDAVRWINNVLVWLYEGQEGAKVIKEAWNDCLNDVTVSSALETGVLVEVLEVLPQTQPPICSNVITDCDPHDNITMSCDIDLTAYLRVQTTRTQKEVTTESEYACSIVPLRGRLNVDVETYDCSAVLRLVGWPEVSLNTEGVRNNTTGLDEDQLQEVLKEVLAGALRSVVLQLHFCEYSSFPRFKRAREAPDPVIPVGYDSLVSAATLDNANMIALQDNKSAEINHVSRPFYSSAIPNQHVQAPNAFLRPFNPPNLNDSVSTDEEVIEEAEESFTSMRLPLPITIITEPTPNLEVSGNQERRNVLTISEESLVARNIAQYGTSSSTDRDDSFDQVDIQNKLNSSSLASNHLRQSRIEEVGRHNLSNKQRTRSRSPVRRSIPRESIMGRSRLNETVMQNSDDDEEPTGRTSPLQLPWTTYGGKSSDEDDDPEYLKEILQQTSSLAGRSSSFNTNSSHSGLMGLSGKKLLVKVVKASDVIVNKGVRGIYVDVEIDEPNQKYTTTVVKNSYPIWDQQFVFDLNEHTLELLFEVYESPERRFLGLGIVGIEELIATPSQRQVIVLQARPYEEDAVSGSLTCEFLFLDKSGLTDVSLVKSSSTKQLNGSTVRTTTTIYAKDSNHITDDLKGYQSDDVAEVALKDLELRNHTNNPQTKSTLIIHASRKPMDDSDDEFYSRPPLKLVPPPCPLTATFPPPPITKRSKQESATQKDASPTLPHDYRGRSREKKMNFFGSLRKRFGKSKDRSRSMEPTAQGRESSATIDPLVGRSVSVERKAKADGKMKTTCSGSTEEPAVNENSTKGFLTVPRLHGNRAYGETGSARSSVSGLSGLSSASNRTYCNEDSLLIVETRERSNLKYYLVPIDIQKEGKFKKRGKKMHIYNEHRFVAKHLPSSTPCEVCHLTVGRSLGKQAYKCRDCGFITHKPCHVQVTTACTNPKVNSMDVTYVRRKKTNFRSSEIDRPEVV